MLQTFNDSDPNYVWIPARPNEKLDYTWDWGAQLAEDGNDTIDAGLVAVTAHASVTYLSRILTATKVTGWFELGASKGEDLWIRCVLTTIGGRRYDKTLWLRVR